MRPGVPRESFSPRAALGTGGQEEPWGPLPPRSRKRWLAVLGVVVVSGMAGFGTFLFLTGDVGQVTSAETSATTASSETTTTTTSEPETEEDEEGPEDEEPPPDEESAAPAPAPEEPEAPEEPAPAPDDSGGVSGPGPEETVRAFWDAMKNEDCETVIDLSTEDSWAMDGQISRDQAIAACQDSPSGAMGMAVEDVKLIQELGNEAAVEVTMSMSGESMTQVMALQVEDGRWKIAGF